MMEIPEHLKSRAKDLGLMLYSSHPNEDWLILKFWLKIYESGEYTKVFPPEYRSLSGVLNNFQRPTVTLYTFNQENEINLVMWLRAATNSDEEKTIITGLWIEEGHRKSKESFKVVDLIYDLIFNYYENCMLFTWQEEKIKVFEKSGHRLISVIPSLHGIDGVFLLFLTKEDYYNSTFRQLASRV